MLCLFIMVMIAILGNVYDIRRNFIDDAVVIVDRCKFVLLLSKNDLHRIICWI